MFPVSGSLGSGATVHASKHRAYHRRQDSALLLLGVLLRARVSKPHRTSSLCSLQTTWVKAQCLGTYRVSFTPAGICLVWFAADWGFDQSPVLFAMSRAAPSCRKACRSVPVPRSVCVIWRVGLFMYLLAFVLFHAGHCVSANSISKDGINSQEGLSLLTVHWPLLCHASARFQAASRLRRWASAGSFPAPGLTLLPRCPCSATATLHPARGVSLLSASSLLGRPLCNLLHL